MPKLMRTTSSAYLKGLEPKTNKCLSFSQSYQSCVQGVDKYLNMALFRILKYMNVDKHLMSRPIRFHPVIKCTRKHIKLVYCYLNCVIDYYTCIYDYCDIIGRYTRFWY